VKALRHCVIPSCQMRPDPKGLTGGSAGPDRRIIAGGRPAFQMQLTGRTIFGEQPDFGFGIACGAGPVGPSVSVPELATGNSQLATSRPLS
jgi:hypothetical protein